jgi:hypothetical protein
MAFRIMAFRIMASRTTAVMAPMDSLDTMNEEKGTTTAMTVVIVASKRVRGEDRIADGTSQIPVFRASL